MIITGFANSPDRGRGFARDMVVRWALEELGLPYEVRSLSFEQLKQDAHLHLQPFGQIPTLETDDLQVFETGAILLALAERHKALLPPQKNQRAKAVSWMFAAVATIEPVIVEREAAFLTEAQQPWFKDRLPIMEQRIHARLTRLSDALGDSQWLQSDFGAADILMVSALRRLSKPLLELHPSLAAYVERATSRPAFKRAYDAQHQLWLSYQS